MEIANLQAFVAIADSGSFSAAANRLYLSQPAISKRISQLEAEFETRLFDRIGRSIHLTSAGEALYPRAKQLLQEIDDVHRAINSMKDKVSGQLVMATSHHIALHRLPAYLKRYNRMFPGVHLDLRFTDSETGCLQVEKGELEFAVITLPAQPPAPLQVLPLWTDELSVVVAAEHPLADHKEVSLQKLLEYDAILPEQGTYTRDIVHREFETESSKLKVGLTSNYLETIKMLVAVGLGWSILPRSMLKDKQLIELTPEKIRLSRELGIVYHPNKTLSNAARKFIELLQEPVTI